MAYDELVRSMEVAADQKNSETLERASRDAEEIIRDAEKRASVVREGYLQDARHRAGVERNRLMYLTNEEIKAFITREKEELFSKVFLVALEKLSVFRESPRYPELFQKLLDEAVLETGTEEYVLHIDRRDLRTCELIRTRHQIPPVILTDLECAGGLSLASSDGKITLDNTVESRLEKAKSAYKLEIFTELSGD